MSPPGLMAESGKGGSCAPSRDELINAACLIRDNCGLSFGTRHINRLVDRFKVRAPHAPGIVFFQYFCGEVQLTVEAQHRLLQDPDIARCISYSDPVGEEVVAAVMARRPVRAVVSRGL